MTAAPALFDAWPEGYPNAFGTARALSLQLFIPPIDDDVHFKERVRGRCLPISPKCPSCGVSKTRVQMYNPQRTTNWEEWVGKQALNQLRSVHLEGQDFVLPIKESRIVVSLRFNLRKPTSYPKSVIHHVRKPDIDNLSKGLFDGLTKAGILADDNMITDEFTQKRYPEPGHPVGVEVDLTAIVL